MATFYEFDLGVGATVYATDSSTVVMTGGVRKTPDLIVEGDLISYVAGEVSPVTAIRTTQE